LYLDRLLLSGRDETRFTIRAVAAVDAASDLESHLDQPSTFA
jgi:hypothetical protein